MKQKRAAEWMAELWRSRSGRVSQQVLHEYYVTVTRKLRPGLPIAAARDDVRALSGWKPVATDSALIERAWAIEDREGLSFWDALIVAAAVASDATVLLTEDLQDGAAIDGVVIVNPFRSGPRPQTFTTAKPSRRSEEHVRLAPERRRAGRPTTAGRTPTLHDHGFS